MPSFFEGLKRLVVGQPVFKPGEGVDGVTHKSDVQEAAPPTQEQPVVADAVERPGPKVIPQVTIERVEYRNNGSNMEVDLEVKNYSDRVVMIDNVSILGMTRSIALVLQPGEQREIPVYNGPRPNHRNYTNSNLKYSDEATGDYFSSEHIVEYEQEPDQTYTIRRIRFIPPVRDI